MVNDAAGASERGGGPRPDAPALSIVIPVYNEEDNIGPLYQRLTQTLHDLGKTYEIVFVDDGSTDQSYERLRAIYDEDACVRVIRFVRNFGQQMAISAAFKYAYGKVIVLLDADLQVLPEEIPRLLDKLAEGHDIVYGVRTQRVGSLLRRFGSWGMSHLLYRVTGIDIPDSASGFIALDRRFVDTINLFNEKSRYLSGLFAWLSYGRWGAVPVSHAARHTGDSKYSVPQLVALTLNFVCNFTMLPLRLIFHAGLILMGLSGCALLIFACLDLLGPDGGRLAAWIIVAAVGFFSGVQLVAIGILGEYLGRVYREVREQPAFVVKDVLERATSSGAKEGA